MSLVSTSSLIFIQTHAWFLHDSASWAPPCSCRFRLHVATCTSLPREKGVPSYARGRYAATALSRIRYHDDDGGAAEHPSPTVSTKLWCVTFVRDYAKRNPQLVGLEVPGAKGSLECGEL
jgi:hypothetical protein